MGQVLATKLPWTPISPPWSKEDAEKALQLFNNKTSYGEIAVRFNRTRNAVAGLISRFRKKGLVVSKHESPVIRKKRATPERLNPIKVVEVVLRPHRVRLRLIVNETEVTFAELEPHHCRWPIGDPKHSDFRFCGCNHLEGKPYCRAHTIEAGGPAIQRRYR